ncbi:MAG: hypothetical protein ACRETX_10240, partial [Steroidobacteraceae bacterium]
MDRTVLTASDSLRGRPAAAERRSVPRGRPQARRVSGAPGRRAVMRVLFVDAGNYCRSPAAEVVARALIGRAHKASQLEVGSAGLK